MDNAYILYPLHFPSWVGVAPSTLNSWHFIQSLCWAGAHNPGISHRLRDRDRDPGEGELLAAWNCPPQLHVKTEVSQEDMGRDTDSIHYTFTENAPRVNSMPQELSPALLK